MDQKCKGRTEPFGFLGVVEEFYREVFVHDLRIPPVVEVDQFG